MSPPSCYFMAATARPVPCCKPSDRRWYTKDTMLTQRERLFLAVVVLASLVGGGVLAAPKRPDVGQTIWAVAQNEHPHEDEVGDLGKTRVVDQPLDLETAPDTPPRPRWGLWGLAAVFVVVVSLLLFSLRFAAGRIRRFERQHQTNPKKTEEG